MRAQTFLCDILWLWRQAIITSRTHTGGSNLSVLTWPSQSVALPRGLHCWLDSICLHQNAISLLRYHRSPLLLLPLLPSVSSLNLFLLSHTFSLSLSMPFTFCLSPHLTFLCLSPFSSLRLCPDISPGVFCLCCFSLDAQALTGETRGNKNFFLFPCQQRLGLVCQRYKGYMVWSVELLFEFARRKVFAGLQVSNRWYTYVKKLRIQQSFFQAFSKSIKMILEIRDQETEEYPLILSLYLWIKNTGEHS